MVCVIVRAEKFEFCCASLGSRCGAGWEYDAKGACTAMPSTAFVQGVSVDALPVVEVDGLLWIQPPGAPAGSRVLPGLHGRGAIPPDCEVVAEVQVRLAIFTRLKELPLQAEVMLTLDTDRWMRRPVRVCL